MQEPLKIDSETAEMLAAQARARGLSVDEYLKELLEPTSEPRINAPSTRSDAEFEAAMEVFAEGTDDVQPYTGTYSREDIYFDHD